jgi:hypothetical protein
MTRTSAMSPRHDPHLELLASNRVFPPPVGARKRADLLTSPTIIPLPCDEVPDMPM